jgi:sugar porter (SP) family MFS transporter
MSKLLLNTPEYKIENVWKLALNASWGSFVFGYTIGVFTSIQDNVSAALGWGGDKDLYITFFSAMPSFGAMFGALISAVLGRKYGRRKALMITDIISIIGTGIIMIPYTYAFGLGRFVTGFAAGSFACLVPLYVNEIAPLEVGGKIGGIIQFQVTFGIVVSYAVALILPTGDYDNNSLNQLWVAIFGLQAAFPLLQFFMYLGHYHSETPRWLIENKKFDLALVSLKEVYSEEAAEKILRKYEDINKQSVIEMGVDDVDKQYEEPTYEDIFKCNKNIGKMIRLGCMINFFQQFSGMNAILSFSTKIFDDIGGGEFLSRVFTLIVGIVNMASTLSVFPVIEKAGRKKLVLFGSLGMAGSLGLVGLFSSVLDIAGAAPNIIFVLIFIFFFEASIGPVCWIYCGEILPARAMSICVFVNWFSCFVVILSFNYIVDVIDFYGAFIFYAVVNILGFFYFSCDMIETKGLDKAEIRRKLTKSS